jgi:hypothetical protein
MKEVLYTIFPFFLFINTTLAQYPAGYAIAFDGNGDYAATVNEPFLPTRNGTIEGWIISTTMNTIGSHFFTKNREQWNNGDMYLFFAPSYGRLTAIVQSSEYNPIEVIVDSNEDLWIYNRWIHVAFSWGVEGMRMYINGELQNNQNNYIHSAMDNIYNFFVGAHRYKALSGDYVVFKYFTGQMDEIRIWNHQRTATQIISVMNSTLGSNYYFNLDSGLVGYWRFDELEDLGINNDGMDDVRDLSVLHNHLDLEGGAQLVESTAPIPVELVSFSASQNNFQIHLSWITATELNNQGFEIERKIFNEWEKIGFVEGNGTSIDKHYYSFSDVLNSFIGIEYIYYRLKQKDFDGTFEYSNEVEVLVSKPDNFSLKQNYPNPFNPSTKINFEIAEDSYVSLIIYDMLGNAVTTLISEELPSGRYDVDFNASELSSGTYLYKLSANDFIEVKKMILLK